MGCDASSSARSPKLDLSVDTSAAARQMSCLCRNARRLCACLTLAILNAAARRGGGAQSLRAQAASVMCFAIRKQKKMHQVRHNIMALRAPLMMRRRVTQGGRGAHCRVRIHVVDS